MSSQSRLYESDFEETTIERLKTLGYEYIPAYEWDSRSSLADVVMEERLEKYLYDTYPTFPKEYMSALISQITNVDGVTVEQRNERFNDVLTKGIDFKIKQENNDNQFYHISPINWEKPLENDFVVMNQLAIDGRMSRRPDIIVYINGLPLILFELKSPYKENTTVQNAYTQVRNYTHDIAQLFNYNAFSVISDGTTTLHGMPFAPIEFFSAWKSIDGVNIDNNIASTMKTLIEGLFQKDRLLNYIQNFIVFMDNGKVKAKIGAKYHQFFGVNFAVQESIRATSPNGDKKIGVIWHTQGSGKSISMLFFAGILIRHSELKNPTVVIQVDRADLDNQLHDTFVEGKSLVGHVKQASSASDLRELLKNESGQIIFTTIEKFRLKKLEGVHPVLSERENIIVIADEAHRTQYNDAGYAGHIKTALPYASHIGFTGTPVDFTGRSTNAVFGHTIHTYDMLQSVEDNATVPIYYESRLIRLGITNDEIDSQIEELGAEESNDKLEKHYRAWAALAKLAGTKERVEQLAKTILDHFDEKQIVTPEAKGMVVCMSRENCVALYNEMLKLPNCPSVEIIMTGDVSKDPEEWRQKQEGSNYSHIKSKEEQEVVKAKLRDPKDPLKLVIVRDMWLTGFDAKPLTYLYVDKPMKGHNLMQAIARVNRVFPGKQGGTIVDFIGIATQLKEATKKYTDSGGKGDLTFDIEQAEGLFWGFLQEVRGLIPQKLYLNNLTLNEWRALPKVEREDFIAEVVNHFLGGEDKIFLKTQTKLAKSHKLVSHLSSVTLVAGEVLLYEIVKTQLRKISQPIGRDGQYNNNYEKELGQIVNESISSYDALDLFKIAGIEKPNLSVLDDAFLAGLVEKPHIDLRLKLLRQLLEDEIKIKFKKKNPKSKQMSEMLEKTIEDYHNRVISAADVIRFMVEMRNNLDEETKRRMELGLSEEEVAFYEIIANMENATFDNQFMANLVHQVVKNMKKEFQVDWTNPHRQDILSKVNLSIKATLMKNKIKPEQLRFLTNAFVAEAKEQFKDWPIDA